MRTPGFGKQTPEQKSSMLRKIHIILLLLSLPYGFISYMIGIVPGVYEDPIYRWNLYVIFAYVVFALLMLILSWIAEWRKKFTAATVLLYLPFVFSLMSGIFFIYMLVRY